MECKYSRHILLTLSLMFKAKLWPASLQAPFNIVYKSTQKLLNNKCRKETQIKFCTYFSGGVKAGAIWELCLFCQRYSPKY
jgi:hypothetical protein